MPEFGVCAKHDGRMRAERPPSGALRGLARRSIFVALLLILGLSAADRSEAAGDTRFRDWTLACPGDGSGICLAQTQARSAGGASHLQVTRNAEGRAVDLILTTGDKGLADSAPLSLRIDQKAPLSIRYASAVGRNETGRFRLLDAALVKKLVGQMKAGRRLQVSYRDRSGKDRFAEFSLMGLTAALRTGQRAQPAAGPQGPPDLYPPPANDGRPEAMIKTEREGSLFTPAGQTPPVGGCYEHRRIHDDNGYFTGWISINRC